MNEIAAVTDASGLTIADARIGYFKPNVPLSMIVESPKNPRRHYDAKRMGDLVASIKQRGVLEPVLLRPTTRDGKDRLELAAGHRRTRAAPLAGLHEVPAIIRAIPDSEFLEILTISNLQREDVNAVEEAEGYRLMLSEGGYDVPSLAEKLGKSESYVYGRLKLLDLDVAVKEALARDLLQLAHATELGKVDVTAQREALRVLFNLDPKKLEAAAIAQDDIESPSSDPNSEVFDEFDDDELSDPDDVDNDRFVASEQLNREAQAEKAFRVKDYLRVERPSVGELRRHLVNNVYVSLAKAPFDRTDHELVPSAGACLLCPKRSGASIGLFPELEKDADACLDRACFHSKVLAHIEKVVESERVAHDGAIDVVKLSAEYSKVPKGVLKPGMYKPLGPSSDDRPNRKARIGVYIDGVARGQAVWIKVDDELAEKAIAGKAVKASNSAQTTQAGQSEPSRDWEAERREKDLHRERTQFALDEVLTQIAEGLQVEPLHTIDALRVVASVLVVRATEEDARRCLEWVRGTEAAALVPRAELETELRTAVMSAEEDALQCAVLLLAVGRGIAVGWNAEISDEVRCLGDHFELDVKSLVKARVKELAAEEKRKAREAAKTAESTDTPAPTKRGKKVA